MLAVVFDVVKKRIPNWLVLAGIAVGIFLNGWLGMPQLFDSLLGLGLGLVILIVPFSFGWLGAGDVKFFGAVGALLGVKNVPRIFFYSALLGGLLAFASIVAAGNFRMFKTAWGEFKLLLLSRGAISPEADKKRQNGSVPYGVAIGLGTLIAFYLDPAGEWAGF